MNVKTFEDGSKIALAGALVGAAAGAVIAVTAGFATWKLDDVKRSLFHKKA